MVKIFVKVKPRAREDGVTVVSATQLEVSVRSLPESGRANRAVEKAIAGHFHIAPSRVKIIKGRASRNKLVAVDIDFN